ncbi:MAG: class I SAM-dependent methyltransferase [Gammaproteobacteria bacterium]
MIEQHTAELLFHGPIADEYHWLKKICPPAAEMSRRVAEFVGDWMPAYPCTRLKLLEIGSGTGLTTVRLLACCDAMDIVSLDNAPAMLSQARQHLAREIEEGRLQLLEMDALSYLQGMPDGSFDTIASAYTLHNFQNGYRRQVLEEILRVLRPGGLFVNGDRYADDDMGEHLKNTQEEVRHYFRVLLDEGRPDLLEQWIVHLFSDESGHHIMRLKPSLDAMAAIGFLDIGLHFREGTNALISAMKRRP